MCWLLDRLLAFENYVTSQCISESDPRTTTTPDSCAAIMQDVWMIVSKSETLRNAQRYAMTSQKRKYSGDPALRDCMRRGYA